MARALITRPAEDAAPLAEALRARGIDPLIDPMLRIEMEDGAPLPLDGVQVVLFTSANGVRAFARRTDRRDLPAYAVGDATAEAARDAGFSEVRSAGGDAAALAALVKAELHPDGGALLHARGAAVAGDLADTLGAAGFDLRIAELYRAVPADRLADETRRALAEGTLAFALFFSPRTARIFAEAVRAAGLAAAVAPVVAIALSQAVADALGALSWHRIAVAESPTQDALLAALDAEPPLAAEPPMADQPSPADPPAPPSRTPAMIAAIAAVVAIVAGTAATWPWWGPAIGFAPPGAVSTSRIDQLESDFASLKSQLAAQMTNLAKRQDEIGGKADANTKALDAASGKVAALDAQIGKLSQAAGNAANLGARLDALEKQLDAVDSKLAALAGQGGEIARLGQTVKGLEPRVAALEKAARAQAREGVGLVVTAASLADAVRTGEPYATPLATISALARTDMDIEHQVAMLRPHARTGVATAAALAARFPAVADAVTRAAIAPKGASWLDRLIARLSTLVTIRRTGASAKGHTPAAIVARAEADLKAGDLAGAGGEIETLQGAPAQAASSWLADAQARLGALRAAKAVSDLAMQAYLHPGATTPAAAPQPAPPKAAPPKPAAAPPPPQAAAPQAPASQAPASKPQASQPPQPQPEAPQTPAPQAPTSQPATPPASQSAAPQPPASQSSPPPAPAEPSLPQPAAPK